MSQWLTNLRKKPKHVRDNIALALSGGFTFAVFAVWFLGGNMGQSLLTSEEGKPEFFKTFLGEFGKQVASIKDTMPEKKDAASAATSTKVFPEAGPATTATSSWALGTSTATSSPAPRPVMIVTTSSTIATTSATEL